MIQHKRANVNLALDDNLCTNLKHLAQFNKESVSILVSRILAQSIEEKEGVADQLTLAVRRAVRDTMKPVENALAKFASKTAITAATGMYLGVQCAADLGAKEVVLMHRQAETMARNDLM